MLHICACKMKSDPRGCECEESRVRKTIQIWGTKTAQQISDCETLLRTGLCQHDRRECLMQATIRGDVLGLRFGSQLAAVASR